MSDSETSESFRSPETSIESSDDEPQLGRSPSTNTGRGLEPSPPQSGLTTTVQRETVGEHSGPLSKQQIDQLFERALRLAPRQTDVQSPRDQPIDKTTANTDENERRVTRPHRGKTPTGIRSEAGTSSQTAYRGFRVLSGTRPPKRKQPATISTADTHKQPRMQLASKPQIPKIYTREEREAEIQRILKEDETYKRLKNDWHRDVYVEMLRALPLTETDNNQPTRLVIRPCISRVFRGEISMEVWTRANLFCEFYIDNLRYTDGREVKVGKPQRKSLFPEGTPGVHRLIHIFGVSRDEHGH